MGGPHPFPLDDADLVVTHLDQTRIAAYNATRAHKPLVHLIHNDAQLRFHRVKAHEAALVVFNSQWVANVAQWEGPQIVLPPPVFANDYKVPPPFQRRPSLVLVNLSEAKGGPLFWELARRQPRRHFIGVLGAYGEQIVPEDIPKNVEVWENRPDPRDFYRRAWVILMPSSYESWGRVPVEAAASGIPTIANPTLGLGESMGPAAIFASRDRIEDWEWALTMLDDYRFYQERAALARARSKMLNPEPGLMALEAQLQATIERGVPKMVPRGKDPFRPRR